MAMQELKVWMDFFVVACIIVGFKINVKLFPHTFFPVAWGLDHDGSAQNRQN